MRAWGCWARRSFAYAMRGRTTSSAKRVSPVTFAPASTLGSGCPTTEGGRSPDLLTGAGPGPRGRDPRRGELDGVQDLRVPRAATEIPGEGRPDPVAIGPRRRVEQRLGGEEDSRRAVPALGGSQLGEGLLQGSQPAALGEAFHG